MKLGVRAAAAGAATSALPLRAMFGSNRTVVCIYLFGGNDSNNLVVKMDAYQRYAQGRGALALPQDALLPVTGASSSMDYGFHPSMPEVADLFRSRALAVVANVGRRSSGALTARGEFNSIGMLDDALDYLPGAIASPSWAHSIGEAQKITGGGGISIAGSQSDAMSDRKLSMGQVNTPFPSTVIGQQLKRVAATIAGSGGGQVYFVPMSGFATGADELNQQKQLYSELSAAMGAFYKATIEIGAANQVVTYTDTECSRTLKPNAWGGADLAWGGHHLVMGGNVSGGDVYGTFPSLELGGADDVTGAGVWMPATAKDRFLSVFAGWIGLPQNTAAASELNFLA